MDQTAIIFYTKPWDMIDEQTGQRKTGITVEYLMAENMNPVVNENGSKGYGYNKESLASDKLPKIKEVPGYYTLKFSLQSGSKGKPVIKLTDIEFLNPVIQEKK
jgi:hypothetical protein